MLHFRSERFKKTKSLSVDRHRPWFLAQISSDHSCVKLRHQWRQNPWQNRLQPENSVCTETGFPSCKVVLFLSSSFSSIFFSFFHFIFFSPCSVFVFSFFFSIFSFFLLLANVYQWNGPFRSPSGTSCSIGLFLLYMYSVLVCFFQVWNVAEVSPQ